MTNHVEFPGLGIELTLNRVAFTLFGVPIYWYGILIATGLLLALAFAFYKARSYGIDSDRMVDVIFGATVCAIIGGRAYYVATAPFEYESFAQMVDIRLGGVGIYGAIIAAFLSGWLLCKWRKVPVLPMFDLASMGFLIGQCIGRWGNFVNQEAFGTNTTLPWGMISESTTAYLASVQQTLAAQGITVDPSLPVHPTFLYESLWCLAGFVLLALYEKHRRFHGEVMLLYVMWYGVGRFFIEGLRTDSLMVGQLRISQVVAASSVLAALALWLVLRKRYAGVPLMVTYTALEKGPDGPAAYAVCWPVGQTPTAGQLKEMLSAEKQRQAAEEEPEDKPEEGPEEKAEDKPEEKPQEGPEEKPEAESAGPQAEKEPAHETQPCPEPAAEEKPEEGPEEEPEDKPEEKPEEEAKTPGQGAAQSPADQPEKARAEELETGTEKPQEETTAAAEPQTANVPQEAAEHAVAPKEQAAPEQAKEEKPGQAQ